MRFGLKRLIALVLKYDTIYLGFWAKPTFSDQFEILNSLCKKIVSGKYEQTDVDKLFEMAKDNRYPSLIVELAESFGMMMVKVEAREFRLKQIIEELKKKSLSKE